MNLEQKDRLAFTILSLYFLSMFVWSVASGYMEHHLMFTGAVLGAFIAFSYLSFPKHDKHELHDGQEVDL